LSADRAAGSEAHWIPLSDLMTGSCHVSIDRSVLHDTGRGGRRQDKDVAVAYSETRDASMRTYAKGSPRSAQMERPAHQGGSDPPVLGSGHLFAQGSSELKPAFKDILNDFFPRYVRILTSPKYRDAITEIRIEDIHHRIGSVVRRPTTPICTTWSFLRHGRDQPCSMC